MHAETPKRMSLTVDTSTETGCCIFRLAGRFIETTNDSSLIDAAESACTDGCRKFVVDLSALTHMNSSGINLLVKTIKRINHDEGRVIFAAVPPNINELLGVIKLNAVLEIKPSVEDGINALQNHES
jgi:anti-anti-sigma factor